MARSGRTINIPTIEEFNQSYSRFCKIKNAGFRGRASKVLLRLINFGIQKEWWEPKQIYKAIIWFGFDNDWINDIFLASITLEYGLKDMNWKKDANIKKALDNGEVNGSTKQ